MKEASDLATIVENTEVGLARRALGVSNSITFPSSSTIIREHDITVFNLKKENGM